MNRIHVQRIAWKDYRRLRSFWLALIGFWVLGLAYATFASAMWQEQYEFSHVVIAAMITVAFYGLGCGGLAFAMEHEEGTYDLLRRFPIRSRNLFYGKSLHVMGSTLALLIALVLLCIFFAIALPSFTSSSGGAVSFQPIHWQPSGQGWIAMLFCAAMIPLAIVLGMFWSMVVKRPFVAIGLAGLSMVAFTIVTGVTAAILFATEQRLETFQFSIWPTLLVFSVIVWYANRHIAERWLVPIAQPMQRLPNATAAANLPTLAVNRVKGWGMKRLLWQQAKQAGVSTLVLGVVGIVLGLASLASGQAQDGMLGVFQGLALLLIILLGIMVFRGEQLQGRFQLMSQLGVRPLPYWVSRIVIPGLPAVLISLLIALSVAASIDGDGKFTREEMLLIWRSSTSVFLCTCGIFSISQFCSIAIRSLILAIAAAMAASIIAWSWTWFSLEINQSPWIGVFLFPIVVLPLIASYLRVPRWFRDTGNWRDWCVPAIPLMLLVTGVPIATAIFRVLEYDRVALAFVEQDPDEWIRGELDPASLERGEQIEIVAASVVTALDEDFELGTGEALRDKIESYDEFSLSANWSGARIRDAGHVLSGNAMLAMREEGQLDEAWSYWRAELRLARQSNDGVGGNDRATQAYSMEHEVYRRLVEWAMHTDNSPERIERIAKWLDNYRINQPPWTDQLKREYSQTTQLIEGAATWNPDLKRKADILRKIAPWELVRTRRMRDNLMAIKCGQLITMQADPNQIPSYSNIEIDWGRGNRLLSLMSKNSADEIALGAAMIEHERRGVLYQLAAIAYHRRHGRYPESFDAAQLDGVTLPNCLFNTGQKMKLHIDESRDAKSRWIVSWPYPVESQFQWWEQRRLRAFLLPDFDTWDRDKYWEESATTPALGDMAGSRFGIGSPFIDPREPEEALATPPLFPAPTASSTDWQSIWATLDLAPSKEVVIAALRASFQTEDPQRRVALLKQLSSVPDVSLVPLLDVLADCVKQGSPDVAATAAHTILHALNSGDSREGGLAVEMVQAHLPTSSRGGNSEGRIGIPLRNPDNGHYYELVVESQPLSWFNAQQAASQRQFRETQGHLATITSATENEFAARLLAQRAGHEFSIWATCWLGGSDSEREGEWKWTDGPEQGEVFWTGTPSVDETANVEETANRFQNWVVIEQEEKGDWLMMLGVARGEHELVSDSDQSGMQLLRARSVSADGGWAAIDELGHGQVTAYLVEYSGTFDDTADDANADEASADDANADESFDAESLPQQDAASPNDPGPPPADL